MGSFKIDEVNDMKSGICEKFSHGKGNWQRFLV